MSSKSSETTGYRNPEPRDESWTGSAHGEIGYDVARRGSSADAAMAPAKADTGTSLASERTPFPPLPSMPSLRHVNVVGRTGKEYQVPALARPSDLPTILDQIEALQIELSPVEAGTIAVRLRVLLLHYGQQQPSDPTLAKAFWADWISDLQHSSEKAFEAAVTAWRQSTERFKPTPGLLLKLIKEMEAPLRDRLSLCLELERVESGAAIVRNVPSGPLTAADVKQGRINALRRERADRANSCLPFRFELPADVSERDWLAGEVRRIDREIAELEAMES